MTSQVMVSESSARLARYRLLLLECHHSGLKGCSDMEIRQTKL